MTREEMQRFLNYQASEGKTKQQALEALAEILGIKFPETTKETDSEIQTE